MTKDGISKSLFSIIENENIALSTKKKSSGESPIYTCIFVLRNEYLLLYLNKYKKMRKNTEDKYNFYEAAMSLSLDIFS